MEKGFKKGIKVKIVRFKYNKLILKFQRCRDSHSLISVFSLNEYNNNLVTFIKPSQKSKLSPKTGPKTDNSIFKIHLL